MRERKIWEGDGDFCVGGDLIPAKETSTLRHFATDGRTEK